MKESCSPSETCCQRLGKHPVYTKSTKTNKSYTLTEQEFNLLNENIYFLVILLKVKLVSYPICCVYTSKTLLQALEY